MYSVRPSARQWMVSAGSSVLAGELAVEVGVFLGGDVGLRFGPQRRALADAARLLAGRADDLDGNGDGAGMLAQHALDAIGLQKFVAVGVEMQRDARADLGRVVDGRRGDCVGALAVGSPQPGLVRAGAARRHLDLVGDHEHRIETDAELADQPLPEPGLVVAADPVEKGARAGIGDRAERRDQLVLAHADAIVGDGEQALFLVERDGDERRASLGGQRLVGQRLVAQLLAGVGGVGDEFAQEHVALGIDGMRHHLQQARHVGGKAVAAGPRVRIEGRCVSHFGGSNE